MISDHLKAVMDRAAQLPPSMQDELARMVEEALRDMTLPAPLLSPEWRESVKRVMQEQAETLGYLKDK